MKLWDMTKDQMEQLLKGLIASGYMEFTISNDGGDERKRYYRTMKKVEKGNSKDVLWFIKRHGEATVTEIRRFMILDAREWESIRDNMLEDGMITKEQGFWRMS